MDFLRRIGRFIGGAAQNVGRAVQQAPRFISRGVQDAERARQQAVAQVQRNLPRFQAPPPPRIQLPQIQIPRVQAPKIDLGAVSRALQGVGQGADITRRTAFGQQLTPQQQRIVGTSPQLQSQLRLLSRMPKPEQIAQVALPAYGLYKNKSQVDRTLKSISPTYQKLTTEAPNTAQGFAMSVQQAAKLAAGQKVSQQEVNKMNELYAKGLFPSLQVGKKPTLKGFVTDVTRTGVPVGVEVGSLATGTKLAGLSTGQKAIQLGKAGLVGGTAYTGQDILTGPGTLQQRVQRAPQTFATSAGLTAGGELVGFGASKLLGRVGKALFGELKGAEKTAVNVAAQAKGREILSTLKGTKTAQQVDNVLTQNGLQLPSNIRTQVNNQIAGTTNTNQIRNILKNAVAEAQATPTIPVRPQRIADQVPSSAMQPRLPKIDVTSAEAKSLKPTTVEISKLKSIAGDKKLAMEDFKAGRYSMTDLPVLVRKEKNGALTVLDGNGRIIAAQQAGQTNIPITTNEKLYRQILTAREEATGRGFAPGTTDNIYETVPESAMRPKAPKGESTLADIQISTKPVVPKEPISAKAQEVKSQFLNRFDSIERFVRKIELERGTKLKPSENPMYYVKQFMGGGGIANYRIDNELTPMLKQTKNFDGLRQYLVARRMNELASRGIGKKANAAIAELTQKYGPDEIANFDRISTQLYQYQRNQLDQLLATGVISKQSYDNIIAKNQFYIPFNRVIPDVISDVTQSGQKISGAKKLASLKAIKGSEKDIIDPIESVIKNTYDVQATVAKQKVLNSLVALAPDEFKPLAKGAGLKAPAIELFADGKRVKLAADPELAKALNSMDEEQLNLVIRAMSLPAKTLRAGATSLNVAFALPNILRDQLSAAVNSKYGGIPMYDFVSGLASVIKKDDSYKKWILSGADQATLFAQDRTTLQRGVKDITGGLGFKAGKLVKSPLELFRIFGDLSEKGSRVGVFKRALKGAGKEGLNAEDALLTAMRESREATIDFAQRGSKMKAFNAMVPFLNARVQGTYKLIQSFKNRPVQTMMRGAAIASAPAAILFIHNNAEGNAEVYNEIPDYVKREYFVIVTGDEKTPFIKIPKGEVGKIFANPVESFMAAVKNDNPNWSDTAKSIADSFLPVGSISEPARFITDIGPTAVTVPYQVLSNYDVFRGQNIVGQYQKDLPAAQQFSKYNTETAKKLGELLNISPAQLEFALSGFTGGLGRQGLQVADIAQGQRPPVQELPVLSRFLGQEKDLSASAQEVYKQAEKAKQQKARENFAIKEALRKGDTSVLEGLDKAAATRLKRTVEEEKIKENLNPLEKSLFSLSKDQLETMKNSEYKDSVEKVIALQESLKSKSNKERVPKIKKTLPKQKRWGKKGRKAKVAKVKIPRPRKVSVTGVPKTPKITLAKVSTKGIKLKSSPRKSIKIKTG